MIVLDTNVVSALMRPELNRSVSEWANGQPASQLWITTISLLEIRSGLLFMPEGRRRTQLADGFDALLSTIFNERLLPFDAEAAEQAAKVDLIQHRSGRDIGTGDIQIAGVVRARRAMLATRNIRHFADLDIPLIDPWTA
jgi:predicted nucleic acid-binding protein